MKVLLLFDTPDFLTTLRPCFLLWLYQTLHLSVVPALKVSTYIESTYTHNMLLGYVVEYSAFPTLMSLIKAHVHLLILSRRYQTANRFACNKLNIPPWTIGRVQYRKHRPTHLFKTELILETWDYFSVVNRVEMCHRERNEWH